MEQGSKIKKYWFIAAIVLAAGLFAYLVLLPWVAAYYAEQGRALLNEQKFEEAQEKLEFSLKLNSRDPLSHSYLGSGYMGRTDQDGVEYYPDADYINAITHYEMAIDLGLAEHEKQTTYLQTLDRLMYSHWKLKQYDKMVERALILIEKFPQYSFWPKYFVANHYFDRANKPEEALLMLEGLPSMAKSDNKGQMRILPQVYLLLSRFSFYFEKLDKAQEYANMVLDSANVDKNQREIGIAHNLLAVVAGSRSNFFLAADEVKKAEDFIGPQQCVLAQAYFFGKNYSQAITVAEDVKTYPNDYLKSICLMVLAEAELVKGNPKAARAHMEEYMSVTDGMVDKNIFVVRNRERFLGLIRNSL